MKHLLIPLAIVMIGSALSCAGNTSKSAAEATTASPAPGSEAEPAPAVQDSDAGPTDRLGPETMPDRQAEPLQFLYWRVDNMFAREDTDGDGKISAVEFTGEPANFERIDADADGFITKQEVLDDLVPKMQESGEIP